MNDIDSNAEWLETDGLGGFASGTKDGIRTRRYHGLLLAAVTPPTQRFMLVNGLEVFAHTPSGQFLLTSQSYAGGTTTGDSRVMCESFTIEPWPTWILVLQDGTRLEQQIVVRHGEPATVVRWKRLDGLPHRVQLRVRPLLSGRDFHALHHENSAINFAPSHSADGVVSWRLYEGVPEIAIAHTGGYSHEPLWYRNFHYSVEAERGFDAVEDLASPGCFELTMGPHQVSGLILRARAESDSPLSETFTDPAAEIESIIALELRRRGQFKSPLERAADQYLVTDSAGNKTIIAGYPWFGDWGRDTFIAMRGLLLATKRLGDSQNVLQSWAAHVSEGMLPNRFPDSGEAPEYNTVDAALWFGICCFEFLELARRSRFTVDPDIRGDLLTAVYEILRHYASGTRFGIRMDASDGLLACGESGKSQLTWMDARVDGRPITPRVGKPVEVQALWINVLRLAARHWPMWGEIADKATASFKARFWSEAAGQLNDVVDVDHGEGVDASCRPNQILAVGGLPVCLLDRDRARRVVESVEKQLWTPLGLRTLAPSDPHYAGRYVGGPSARDAVYHQGTAWPWLMGPFVEAWLHVHSDDPQAAAHARQRFLHPLRKHLETAGMGHVSEIVWGNEPHRSCGCPFQAWSTGELLRLEALLAEEAPALSISTSAKLKNRRPAIAESPVPSATASR